MEFDKPKITPEDIQEIVVAFDPGEILEIEYLGGVPNVTYGVRTSNQHLAVRVSNHGYSSLDHIRTEIGILLHLQNVGFNQSPCLVQSLSGKYLEEWKGYPVCATQYIPGYSCDKLPITSEICYDVGIHVAKMQQALSTYNGPLPSSESLTERGILMMEHFPRRAEKIGWKINFGTIIDQWKKSDRLLASHNENLTVQIIHSDVWPPNVISKENKLQGIVDFDDWCVGPAIMDLCAPLIEFPMFYSHEFNSQLAYQLLKGYVDAGGRISKIERELIITGMEVGCAMWLACNALHEVPYEESEIYVHKLNLFADQTQRKKFIQELNEIFAAVYD